MDRNGIFESWLQEAQAEVADKGWRGCSINALLLLTYCMQRDKDDSLAKLINGPVRWFIGVMASGLTWWVIRDFVLQLH